MKLNELKTIVKDVLLIDFMGYNGEDLKTYFIDNDITEEEENQHLINACEFQYQESGKEIYMLIKGELKKWFYIGEFMGACAECSNEIWKNLVFADADGNGFDKVANYIRQQMETKEQIKELINYAREESRKDYADYQKGIWLDVVSELTEIKMQI